MGKLSTAFWRMLTLEGNRMPYTYVTVHTAPVMGIQEIVLVPRIAVDKTGR